MSAAVAAAGPDTETQPIEHSLAEMPHPASRPAPAEVFSAAGRIDPYWAGIWNPGSTATWQSRSSAERLAKMGLGEIPRRMARRSVEESITAVLTRHRAARLSALGAVGMWRTMTDQQLAAIVGRKAMLNHDNADRNVLWSAGLVDEGRFPLSLDRVANQVSLYRPNRASTLKALEERLDYAEWLALTGGQVWGWGAQADRHNLLGTELGLRVAEYTDNVASVMGESMGSLALLCSALGIEIATGTTRAAADAVILREDGMIIAIEVTTAAWRNFREKVQRWATILESDPTRRLAVLFVETSHPDTAKDADTAGETLKLVRGIVAEAANDTAATVAAKVPERMMVASWTDWFPGPGRISTGFTLLRATRPTGFAKDRWRVVDAMSPFSTPDVEGLEPDPEADSALSDEALDAMIDQCRSLYGVPHWLRGPRADFTERMRADNGVQAVPRLPYYRDYVPVAERRNGSPVTAPKTQPRTRPATRKASSTATTTDPWPLVETTAAPSAADPDAIASAGPTPEPTPEPTPGPPASAPASDTAELDAFGFPIAPVADLDAAPVTSPGTDPEAEDSTEDSDGDEPGDEDDPDAGFYESDSEEQW